MTITHPLLADRPEFIPTIAGWYYHKWGQGVENNSVAATVSRISSKLNRTKPPFHLLAVQGEALLGVVQLKHLEMDIYPDRQFWLGSLYVDPRKRGQGIGRALCEQLILRARNLGIGELHLQTEALDGGLYRQLGWRIRNHAHYHGVDVAVMCLDLSALEDF